MAWVTTEVSAAAVLSSFIILPAAPVADAGTPGEAFCAENERRLEYSSGEMPFEINEAVGWLTQKFNMSETEAVRLID